MPLKVRLRPNAAYLGVLALGAALSAFGVSVGILPTDPQGAVRRMRPWVRSEGRTNIGRYGTPIVVPEQSLDHTVSEMQAAIT